jgi:hypothetical protein
MPHFITAERVITQAGRLCPVVFKSLKYMVFLPQKIHLL